MTLIYGIEFENHGTQAKQFIGYFRELKQIMTKDLFDEQSNNGKILLISTFTLVLKIFQRNENFS